MTDTTAPIATISEFVRARGVRVTIVETLGIRKDADKWEHRAYRVRIRLDGRSFTTTWRQGMGIDTTPDQTPTEVFAAVVSDARILQECNGWQDMADTFGYDVDDEDGRRKARKIWRDCSSMWDRLYKLLGEDFGTVLDLENDV